jgi:SAM-dependent methyltransferase
VGPGRSFGQVAADYDRVRPETPAEAIDRVIGDLGLDRSARVVDLGAGTGKLTRLLALRFDDVVAIEPDADMRAFVARKLPTVTAHGGTGEEIPLPDASVDAVFVADAFHWFDASRALAEIARVLRPGGGLAIVWNDWWNVVPPIPPEAEELLREPFVRTGRVLAKTDAWRESFTGQRFAPLREARFEHELRMAAPELVDLQMTSCAIAALAPEDRVRLRTQLLDLLDETYRVPVETAVYWTRRT